jgi:DNA-binding FadR family transcriptional regulator
MTKVQSASEANVVLPLGPLRPLPRRDLIHQQVQSALRDYIVNERLRPGDPLPPESELARALVVSRNSVREAVKALEGVGIIEARSGSGLYVREFTLEAVLGHFAFGMLFDVQALGEILDVRLILETGMVERVVLSTSAEQLERLDETIEDWREATARGEYSASHDRAFHAILYETGHNPLLGQILGAFWRVFYEARGKALVPEPLDPAETLALHVAILEALRKGDVAATRGAVNAHHEGIKRRVEIAAATETIARSSTDDRAAEARPRSSLARSGRQVKR